MTTIAFDGKTLCADSQATLDNLRVPVVEKIKTLHDGRIVALYGNIDAIPLVLQWLNSGEKFSVREDDNFGGIIVDPKTGKAEIFCENLRVWEAQVPWAGGSGTQIAYTVFKMGGDAEAAIQAACQLDIYSSLPVQKVSIMGCKKGGGKKK